MFYSDSYTSRPWRIRTCPECGAELVRTSERYECCPNGHGKLLPCQRFGFRQGIAKREDVTAANLFARAVKAYDRTRNLAGWEPRAPSLYGARCTSPMANEGG